MSVWLHKGRQQGIQADSQRGSGRKHDGGVVSNSHVMQGCSNARHDGIILTKRSRQPCRPIDNRHLLSQMTPVRSPILCGEFLEGREFGVWQRREETEEQVREAFKRCKSGGNSSLPCSPHDNVLITQRSEKAELSAATVRDPKAEGRTHETHDGNRS